MECANCCVLVEKKLVFFPSSARCTCAKQRENKFFNFPVLPNWDSLLRDLCFAYLRERTQKCLQSDLFLFQHHFDLLEVLHEILYNILRSCLVLEISAYSLHINVNTIIPSTFRYIPLSWDKETESYKIEINSSFCCCF